MIPSNQNLGINNVSLTVNTINSQSLTGLVGASVTVNGQTQLSSLFGSAIFTVPTNTTYSVKGSLSGFVPSSQTVVVGSSNAVVTLYMAPVVTTTVTIPVTTTTINTTGNYNAIVGSNTKGVTCNPNYATTGNLSNLVGLLQNDAACAGVQTQQNQNGLIAMGICIVLVLIGAEKGKGLGAVVGAIIGYVAALLMGLIPMWSLFAFCVLAGLVFAAKIVLSQGDK